MSAQNHLFSFHRLLINTVVGIVVVVVVVVVVVSYLFSLTVNDVVSQLHAIHV